MELRPNVFLVEADKDAENRALRAIANSGVDCDVRVARDGDEACDVLFANTRPPPFLVLLELDLPNLNGFDVLERIRRNENTKRLPVVVFTGSSKRTDAKRCFDLGANSYVHKDKDEDRFDARLKLVLYYWMAVNSNG